MEPPSVVVPALINDLSYVKENNCSKSIVYLVSKYTVTRLPVYPVTSIRPREK